MKTSKKAGMITAFGMVAVFVLLMLILSHFRLDSPGPLQVMQVAMDVFGMSLGLFLFMICTWDSDDGKGLKRYFLCLITAVYAGLFLDAAVFVTGGHQESRIVSIILESLLYLSNPITTYAFYSWVKKYLGAAETKFGKRLELLMRIGLGASALIRIVNLFYPVYFLFDEAGVYQRGPYYIFSCLYPCIGAVVIILLMIRFRKNLRLGQSIALIIAVLLPLLTIAVNVAYLGLTLTFAVMMWILTVLYLLQNVEKKRNSSAVRAELSSVKRMQRSLLPNLLPEISPREEYDLYAAIIPAREMGGDFYDFFMVEENTLAFLMADVSDKGAGAALFMTAAKSMIRTRAIEGGSPAEVLRDVNEKIGENNDSGMFVTVWLGYLDLTTGHIRACNAGLVNPAWYLRKEDKETYTIPEMKHAPAVGLMTGTEFPELELDMEPGDKVFLYTDGIRTAQKKSGEQFGPDRLLAALSSNLEEDSEGICTSVKRALYAFIGNDPQFDDMTMLALTYLGPHHG